MAKDYNTRCCREKAPHRNERFPVERIGDNEASEDNRAQKDHRALRQQQERQTGRGEISNADHVRMLVFRYVDDVAILDGRDMRMAEQPAQQ